MSTPAIAPTHAATPSKFSALLGLLLLLLGTLAVAMVITVYLLRLSIVPKASVSLPPPPPAPFRLLALRAGQLWSVGTDGRQQQVTRVPESISARVRRAVLSPDGSRAVLITGAGQTERAWLLSVPGATPQPLVDPGLASGTGPRRYLDVVWRNPQSPCLLVAQHGRLWLARYALRGERSLRAASWTALTVHPGQALSLSPDGRQVALALLEPGTNGFGPQVIVRLQQIDGVHSSVAYRYLGATLPGAVLWTPDDGTVAIQTAAQGLAMQKSSGRPVRLAPNGTLPAVFSVGNAQFAYVAGRPGAWEIHILSLHGERDRSILSALRTPPSNLYWTPDARALLYTLGRALWQVNPTTGAVGLIAGDLQGTVLQAISTANGVAR
jgi:hypothetical protein